MGAKTIKGSMKLAEAIRQRRTELNLTIEEAATRAGVGTKTWSRYECGESIRRDKCKGICKALNWRSIPGTENDDWGFSHCLDEYKQHEAWSSSLAKTCGTLAAISFAIGSDILLDYINDDIEMLSSKPKGTHIGEIEISYLKDLLPEQFLMHYDYNFLYALQFTVRRFRTLAHQKSNILAHSVMEELALYLMLECSEFWMESMDSEFTDDDNEAWREWPFMLFDDMDIITYLYSDLFLLGEKDSYHFDHWLEPQFYISSQ